MSEHAHNGVYRLVKGLLGVSAANALLTQLEIDPRLIRPVGETVSRAEMAQALNMVLFYDLHERVPEGHDYVQDVMAAGQKITFDHGALRTVAWPSGALPPGEAAISRVLRPLGFAVADTYPLPRLKMTGRAWAHTDFPETIAQFFVSELHPERFSAEFQAAVTRVLADSVDPLGPQDIGRLERLGRDAALPWPDALALMPKIVACFGRQHGGFALADYETLLAESAEMAWISTEGNAFNHATDRVSDLQALSDGQKKLGRSIKDAIEVSQSGRVMQTAFRAAQVAREFLNADGEWETRHVPGSFYEFIQRERLQCGRVDLAVDAGNATAIFKMTTHEALEILN
jgi:hypothetical protein